MDTYEKKYNEALERAKELLLGNEHSNTIRSYFEHIFPELRENEDEKNANALIRLLNDDKITSLITYEARQQWLNWLERKRTPSVSFDPPAGFDSGSAVVYHNEDSEDERIRKWLTDLFSNRNEKFVQELDNYRGLVTREQILAYLEKQKELMPPINVDPCDASCDAYYQRGLNKGYELGSEAGRKEQKPVAWSEEDKKILDDVSHILIGLNYKQIAKDYKQAVEKLIYARPSWKPSEEQMDALAYAIQLLDDGLSPKAAKAGEELEHLREQLKKL